MVIQNAAIAKLACNAAITPKAPKALSKSPAAKPSIPPTRWFYGLFGVWLAQMFAFTPSD